MIGIFVCILESQHDLLKGRILKQCCLIDAQRSVGALIYFYSSNSNPSQLGINLRKVLN